MADIHIPQGVFGKILSKVSKDENLIIGKDFKEGASKCVKVFQLYLQTISKEIAKENGRATVLPSDVRGAIEEIGFDEFLTRLDELESDLLNKNLAKKELGQRNLREVSSEKDKYLGADEIDLGKQTPSMSVNQD